GLKRKPRFGQSTLPRTRPGRRRTAKLQVEQLETRTLLSVKLGVNFKGMDTNTAGGVVEPPDTSAAAGPNYVVELINSNIAYYNKTTGVVVPGSEVGLDSFFASVDTVMSLYSDVFVTYDEQAGRFLVYTMDIDFFNFVSYFDFAVSNDS